MVAALEMPAELKKAIEASLSHMWMTASKLATVAVEQVRLEAEERVLVVTKERDEALAEIGRLESHVAAQAKALNEKDALISEGTGALEQEKTLHQKTTFENAALSTRLEDRDAQVKTLTADMKTARADYKQLQGELVALAKSAKK
ncbi:MAG: KfrA protein [Alteromonas sp.]|nr:KfrA protein [Alteromonas sp.]